MGGKDDRNAFFLIDLLHDALDGNLVFHINVGRGFVQKNNLWKTCKGPRNGDPLRFSTR